MADELDADVIAWDDALPSGRDRSTAGRLARAFEAGDDELEPASEPLANIRAWLDADGDRPDVREILADLAILDALTYDEHRGAVAKAAGVRASTLDAQRAELLRSTSNGDDGQQGSALLLADIEPWDEPVDGADLLGELARAVTRYVALPDGAATAVALWVLHAHAHDAASVSPLLAPTSPEKRCGKTTLLHVLTGLVPYPVPAANISPAALFRTVEKYAPTLLVDEADTIFGHGGDDRAAELRGLLNSGHSRASAVTIRCVEPDYEPRAFSTWTPKAVALIGELPDTLLDRSIILTMRRRAPGEDIKRLRLDKLDELKPLASKAARWTADYMAKLRGADPDVPAELHDRAADNWRPLLAIADAAGGDWPNRARKAAKLLAAAGGDDDGSVRTLLLADLRSIFGDDERMASADIVEKLTEMEERPWPEWRRGNPLTARSMARLLQPFGVKPRQLWVGGANVRGYERDDFADAFARYLPAQNGAPAPEPPAGSARTARTRGSKGIAPNDEPLGNENPSGSQIAGNPRQQRNLADLADGNPPAGAGNDEDDL